MIVIFNGEYIETIGIKNLLDSFNIKSYIANEYMSSIKPSLISPGGFNTVSLQVDQENLEEAKKILDDYNKGVFSLDFL